VRRGAVASALPALAAGLVVTLLFSLGAGASCAGDGAWARAARKLTEARWLARPSMRSLSPILALSSHDIDEAIFHVASVLEVPVLILALLALAMVILELGSFVIELRRRRRRRFTALSSGAERAREALAIDDRRGAAAALHGLARSAAMADTLAFIAAHARRTGATTSSTRRSPTSTSARDDGSTAPGCSSASDRRSA